MVSLDCASLQSTAGMLRSDCTRGLIGATDSRQVEDQDAGTTLGP